MPRSGILRKADPRKAGLALILLLSATAGQADCLAAGAEYTPASDPDGTKARLQLRPLDPPRMYSDLVLAVLVAGQPDELLHPEQSQGYGSTYVLAAGPALTDLDFPAEFLALGPQARLVPYPQILPQSGTPAPAAIFITGLGAALWYATNGQPEPVSLRNEIWYLTGCD